MFDAEKLAQATIKGLFPDLSVIHYSPDPSVNYLGIADLLVTHQTLGKPETDQSGSYDQDLIVVIPEGEYKDVEIICDEESHYKVLFPELVSTNGQRFLRSYHWVYSGHCEIKNPRTTQSI